MSQKQLDPNEEKHVVDGIVELNHPIPGWFRALFYGTVVFGAAYFFHYTVGSGPSQSEEYARKQAIEETREILAAAQEGGAPDEAELKAAYGDDGRKREGQGLYAARCASCHGSKGEGGIGPNLTDAYWIHGSKLTEIYAVIDAGVLDKGMPPWGPVLKKEEMVSIVAHVRALLGTNPLGAKAAQGDLKKEE